MSTLSKPDLKAWRKEVQGSVYDAASVLRLAQYEHAKWVALLAWLDSEIAKAKP